MLAQGGASVAERTMRNPGGEIGWLGNPEGVALIVEDGQQLLGPPRWGYRSFLARFPGLRTARCPRGAPPWAGIGPSLRDYSWPAI